MITLRFFMSEGQAESFPDWESRELYVSVPESVQVTYGFLRSTLDDRDLGYRNADGYWVGPDNREYSDIVIFEGTP